MVIGTLIIKHKLSLSDQIVNIYQPWVCPMVRGKEHNIRNHVEAKFGQEKNGYNLNRISARRQDTSESWISAVFFVMNLTRLIKVAIESGNFLAHFIKSHVRTIFASVIVYDDSFRVHRRAIVA